MEIEARAGRESNDLGRKTAVSEPLGSSCDCGLSPPKPSDFYEVLFEDGARLFVSAEDFWSRGFCPVSAIQQLIFDFDLSVDDASGVLSAPFPFDHASVPRFLNAVMRLSIKNFDHRVASDGGCC